MVIVLEGVVGSIFVHEFWFLYIIARSCTVHHMHADLESLCKNEEGVINNRRKVNKQMRIEIHVMTYP